jgi:tetratricopeptide (TPR) repeat protein
MVGHFGEVQVMDWGLAKVLTPLDRVTEPASSRDESCQKQEISRMQTPVDWSQAGTVMETPVDLSQTGTAMGTPAFMPPEQATGQPRLVDERADVFALGAILCSILTGRAPYAQGDAVELLRQAKRGDLAEARERLNHCGADAELVTLCQECLAPQREGRPRDAGVVAERVAAYRAGVQERLRQAELERAQAQVKALEERKRRRLEVSLLAAVLLLVVSAGGAIWWQRQWRERADRKATQALEKAQGLYQQAQTNPLEPGGFRTALAAARQANELAGTGASEELLRKASDLTGRLEEEEHSVTKDRRLLTRLLDVRGPREVPKSRSDPASRMMAQDGPTADELFAAAFRDWGLDVDVTPTDQAAARLKARPRPVVTEVVAALDDWTSERQRQGPARQKWQRLADLAAALDDEADSQGGKLRQLLARGQLPVERGLSFLSAAMRPVPVPVVVPLGDCARLRQLALKTNPAAEPVLGLLTLVRALRVAGEDVVAEQVLRAALRRRPQEVVLYHILGQLLTEQQPPRWREAVECYTAARAVRPELGVALGEALVSSGRGGEGVALFALLVQEQPGNPFLHYYHGVALQGRGELERAIAAYRQAIHLDLGYAWAHNNLGNALLARRDLAGAIAAYRQALQIDARYDKAYNNLGVALHIKGDPEGAIAAFRQACALNPTYATAHYNLGFALYARKDLEGAIAAYLDTIALDPRYENAHYNLGLALYVRKDLDGAIAAFQQAIVLDPKNANPSIGLGLSLQEQGDVPGAIAAFRQAIALDPKNSKAYNNLGRALLASGDRDGAIAAYRQAIALDPNNTEALHNLRTTLSQQFPAIPK